MSSAEEINRLSDKQLSTAQKKTQASLLLIQKEVDKRAERKTADLTRQLEELRAAHSHLAQVVTNLEPYQLPEEQNSDVSSDNHQTPNPSDASACSSVTDIQYQRPPRKRSDISPGKRTGTTTRRLREEDRQREAASATGLKDKHGNDIHVGDRVRLLSKTKEGDAFHDVQYARVRGKGKGDRLRLVGCGVNHKTTNRASHNVELALIHPRVDTV